MQQKDDCTYDDCDRLGVYVYVNPVIVCFVWVQRETFISSIGLRLLILPMQNYHYAISWDKKDGTTLRSSKLMRNI